MIKYFLHTVLFRRSSNFFVLFEVCFIAITTFGMDYFHGFTVMLGNSYVQF